MNKHVKVNADADADADANDWVTTQALLDFFRRAKKRQKGSVYDGRLLQTGQT